MSHTQSLTFAFDDHADAGVPIGHARFGDDPILAPPTDPSIGYPPKDEAVTGQNQIGPQDLLGPPESGFWFTIRNGVRSGSHIAFDVSSQELWGSWCALETGKTPASTCIPNVASRTNWGDAGDECFYLDSDTHEYVRVDCLKLMLCRNACECDTPQTCYAPTENTVHVDAVETGDSIDGSITLGTSQALNIHLTRSGSGTP